MPTELISLDEASWRLELSAVSGRVFVELLLTNEPILLGLFPGKALYGPVDLLPVTRLRAEPGNVVVVDGVRWTDIKLNWTEFCAALEKRGQKVPWSWHSYITPELLARARQSTSTRRLLGNPRPPAPLPRAASAVQQPARRARPEWFAEAAFTGAIPLSGKAPPGKRGPKSGKRQNAAAAIAKDLADQTVSVARLKAMPEKELAALYGVSRDTARKARHDVLASRVEISTSTNDK